MKIYQENSWKFGISLIISYLRAPWLFVVDDKTEYNAQAAVKMVHKRNKLFAPCPAIWMKNAPRHSHKSNISRVDGQVINRPMTAMTIFSGTQPSVWNPFWQVINPGMDDVEGPRRFQVKKDPNANISSTAGMEVLQYFLEFSITDVDDLKIETLISKTFIKSNKVRCVFRFRNYLLLKKTIRFFSPQKMVRFFGQK